ncbi:protein yqjC [Yersinia rohdei]|uniref:Protein yqjC n=1 Tax=Yersinia rohdei TaxID=29485 RepID=A0A0U1HNK6_YERRO|nr:DUF1090 domain-containing protein [Yersinia rohdei]AJJ09614.1 protein yqjC [Yersinia rohdei]MDN0095575.1 DUF1090 domain-containing protein [Yersinia rohdei]CNE60716.1 periplasmic protein YqjC [Yersinia rohdei]CQI88141.1 periplasmic protein YqjC [Yersinia rohdei]
MLLRHFLLLVLPMAAFYSTAAQTNGCDIKAQNIQQQINYAKQHGNTQRVAGLETALENVKNNCTVASLQADRDERIQDKQRKVTERQQDLTAAQEKGDADKITKQKKKLAEANAELQAAQAPR